MWQRLIFEFAIRAVSPVRCGAVESEVVKDPNGKPVLLGNSLGGALRDYLRQGGVGKEAIEKIMGGEGEPGNRKGFKPSSIHISDGTVENYADEESDPLPRRQGTKINPVYGAAEQNQKYELEYLPAGTTVSFTIESDVWAGHEAKAGLQLRELEKVVATWANGFAGGAIVLGGRKSNGFGRFTLDSLQKRVFSLSSSQALDRFIFDGDESRPRRRCSGRRCRTIPCCPGEPLLSLCRASFPTACTRLFPWRIRMQAPGRWVPGADRLPVC
ncbi:RAMP superfamily CRISPR-associated protein [Sporomusa termitida]|uniref:CRISPR-associated RAMP protein n=1 Tax=Sporomusa termitida TaxID=2377 RepID=A0A517DNS1_9FIRM|nr:RAMP superfamily CRISPR-associated protein [Sporomusa termitida]QDR78906.1 CRISPR-associated RAMP protein [Sporomusa termitida]